MKQSIAAQNFSLLCTSSGQCPPVMGTGLDSINSIAVGDITVVDYCAAISTELFPGRPLLRSRFTFKNGADRK